ncbi:MAG TPA: hypothetical protein VHI50_09800, partial [Micromonosporaceae bacterium]|nr:hypothetical protein [Micromonosporaceae bacterium]
MRNAEARFLDARDLADRIELGEARGTDVTGLSDRLDAALAGLRAEVAGLSDRLDTALAGRAEVAGLDPDPLGPADAAALAAMRRWLDRPQPPPAGKIIQRYAAAQAAVAVGGTTMTRLAVLGRLALEPSAALRHRLFLALEPVWRSVDGDGAAASPYRGLLRTADVGSALVANARALGLDPACVEPISLRGRYADVMLDICWALFELRLHADPGRRPNDVWTELTSTYLGIAPHPEFSWWAMRGQLVQEPGYMVNYAIAPIIAADLRAAIRAVRGDWVNGDPGWYAWVCEHLYRWGLERPAGD